MNALLFLDIDGVLNDRTWLIDAKSFSVTPKCIPPFNRILKAINPDVVLTSAWRYMILWGAMTVKGFEYLLRSHGVSCDIRIVGALSQNEHCYHCRHVTINDTLFCEHCCLSEKRGHLIDLWLRGKPKCRYLVIDDKPLDILEYRHPLLLTDGKVGLTEVDAANAISTLGGGESVVADGS
jgi:hypothetical protein